MFQDLLIVSLRFSRCYHENPTTMKPADPILKGHPVLSGRVAHYVSNVSGYLIFAKTNLYLAHTKGRSVAFSGRLDSRVLCKVSCACSHLIVNFKYLIIHSPQDFSGIIYSTDWGTLPDCLGAVYK